MEPGQERGQQQGPGAGPGPGASEGPGAGPGTGAGPVPAQMFIWYNTELKIFRRWPYRCSDSTFSIFDAEYHSILSIFGVQSVKVGSYSTLCRI
jgi:hypothetical protein